MTAGNTVEQDLAERVRILEARLDSVRVSTSRPNLRDLRDADLTKAQDGQVPVYDSATGLWKPGTGLALGVGGLRAVARKGGDGTDWSVGGTSSFSTATAATQLGATPAIATTAGAAATLAVTFPTSFVAPPVVLVALAATTGTDKQVVRVSAVSATGFTVSVRNFDSSAGTAVVNWEAIGEFGVPVGGLAEILADGPVLYLPCQETGGAVFDYSGYGHPVTIYNSPSQGVPGPGAWLAIDFDGSSQSIGVPDSSAFSDSTMSWEGWFKPDTNATQEVWVKDTVSNEEWTISISSGYWAATVINGAGGAYLQATSNPTAVDTANWQHVAAVRDGTTLTLYLNGVQVDQDITPSGSPPGDTNSDVRIGGRDISGAEFFYNGSAAHLAIFPTALTAGQVLAHYAAI